MTVDHVALCRDRPDLPTGLGPLRAGRGRVLQLCADDGRPLVTVEGPTLVEVPSEVERLLGVVVDGPVWWVEARARDADAAASARTLLEALAGAHRGLVWP